jgi:hypothetical protein
MGVAGVKKIILAQVAVFRADFKGDVRVVIDDQSDAGAAGDGQDGFGHAADLIGGGILGAELDQVRAAVAKLLRQNPGRAAMKEGGVHERVKPAVGKRFHGDNLAMNHAKHTKELRVQKSIRPAWMVSQ